MQATYQTIPASATVGGQTPVGLDWTIADFKASVAVIVPGGTTVSYGVEYTLDDVNDPTVTPDWLYLTDIPAATTATDTANLTSPVRFIRVNVASISGGPIRFKVVQGSTVV